MDLKTALNQKKSVKSSLTRLKIKIEEDISCKFKVVALNIRRNRFVELGVEIKNIFKSIINECKERGMESYCVERGESLDVFEVILELIYSNILKYSNENHKQRNLRSKSPDSADVKPPILSLPAFSGVIDEWLTFSDLYQASV